MRGQEALDTLKRAAVATNMGEEAGKAVDAARLATSRGMSG